MKASRKSTQVKSITNKNSFKNLPGQGSHEGHCFLPKTSIFIGGISSTTYEEDLVAYFGAFGKILKVHIPLFKKKKINKGFAFVEYSTE